MTFGDYEYGSSPLGSSAPIPGNINIIVTDIIIGTTSCPGGCDITCPSSDCSSPVVIDITITWQNTGDTVGRFTPTISVTPPGSPTPTIYTLSPVDLVAGYVVDTTFTGVSLIQGQNIMCANAE